MESNVLTANVSATQSVLTPEQLLKHWQGHRDLTRRTIEKFPADKLFSYSIGGMRPFSVLAMEVLGIASAGVHGFATNGEWKTMAELLEHTGATNPTTKEELLQLWDIVTEQIDDYWPRIASEDFQRPMKAFGRYEGTVISLLLYFIDNEIHHRGQGFVYLRSLDIEPPFFWDRH
ncbi:MAG: damage-inducible protein DinB [Chitinophaga sp.]|uniref:DinB family protein n=1 Tax=Chitinophaga sp. TaxID=1869181 RepID=UPI001B0E206D|nr:DinB family protein [Chitinophaga sp.]MBO9728758.1 damage-inducible protein DinB [Chitinophaga sp.]